jgi:hypothetical protein
MIAGNVRAFLVICVWMHQNLANHNNGCNLEHLENKTSIIFNVKDKTFQFMLFMYFDIDLDLNHALIVPEPFLNCTLTIPKLYLNHTLTIPYSTMP